MLRALVKRPGLAAVVVATLALVLGATIGVFSVANAVLFRALPYPNADRIVLRTLAEDGSPTGRVAPRDNPTLYDDPNETFARRYFAGGRAVGRSLTLPANLFRMNNVGFRYGELVPERFEIGLAGSAIGAVVAAATGRVLASELYGVSTLDWRVFVAVPLTLLTVALVAAYVPARRASRVDPAAVLQTE